MLLCLVLYQEKDKTEHSGDSNETSSSTEKSKVKQVGLSRLCSIDQTVMRNGGMKATRIRTKTCFFLFFQNGLSAMMKSTFHTDKQVQ